MTFSSDAALAQVPEELRAAMPEFGFRRDHDGHFFYFPHYMVFRGAYEVPDAELPRLVWALRAQNNAWAHLAPALAAIVAFAVALTAGVLLIDANPAVQLPRHVGKGLPTIIFGGSFGMAAAASAIWSRLRSGRFARRHLTGLPYDRKAHRLQIDDRVAPQLRIRLGGGLSGVLVVIVIMVADLGLEALRTGHFAVILYAAFAFALFLIVFLVLAVMTLSEIRPRRWADASSWAFDAEAAARRHVEAVAALKARPLWKKLLVPEHGWGIKALLLDYLHLAVYATILVALAVLATNWWNDRRPADDELLVFFAEAALAAPQRESDPPPVTLKWQRDPAILITGGGEERRREIRALKDLLAELTTLTGLTWHLTDDPQAATIRIELTYQDDTPAPPNTRLANVQYSFDKGGRMTGGKLTLFYRSDYEASLQWGLAKIAGLRGGAKVGNRSILHNASAMTALDRAALLLLYSPEMVPGLPKARPSETARQVVAAWPDTGTIDGLLEGLGARDRP